MHFCVTDSSFDGLMCEGNTTLVTTITASRPGYSSMQFYSVNTLAAIGGEKTYQQPASTSTTGQLTRTGSTRSWRNTTTIGSLSTVSGESKERETTVPAFHNKETSSKVSQSTPNISTTAMSGNLSSAEELNMSSTISERLVVDVSTTI